MTLCFSLSKRAMLALERTSISRNEAHGRGPSEPPRLGARVVHLVSADSIDSLQKVILGRTRSDAGRQVVGEKQFAVFHHRLQIGAREPASGHGDRLDIYCVEPLGDGGPSAFENADPHIRI